MANAGRYCLACYCRSRRAIEGRAVVSNGDLYHRSLLIRDGKANGLWLPIVWHLALRGHPPAMIDLAGWISDSKSSTLRSGWDRFSPSSLQRRAFQSGDHRAAHNLAMMYFQRNSLGMYRQWLRKAASLGDEDSAVELASFAVRLPYTNARKIRRLRPWRKCKDGWR
jgi:hypothetical protein